jgi:hypothetical protein
LRLLEISQFFLGQNSPLDDDDDDVRLRIPTTELLRVVTYCNNTRLWQFPQICVCSDGEVDQVQEVEEAAHFEAGVGGSPL